MKPMFRDDNTNKLHSALKKQLTFVRLDLHVILTDTKWDLDFLCIISYKDFVIHVLN